MKGREWSSAWIHPRVGKRRRGSSVSVARRLFLSSFHLRQHFPSKRTAVSGPGATEGLPDASAPESPPAVPRPDAGPPRGMTSPPSPPTEAGAPFPSRQSSTSSITISRASSKRTLASVPSSEVLAAHPLLSTSPALEPANGAGSYPVYSRHAKRLSQASAESVPLPALSPPTPPPASPSPAPTSSQPTSPLPPLISRPSSSSFPAANRPPARSVSEATRSLLKAKVEGDVQQLGLAMESGGAAMVLKLSALGKEPEWSGVLAALASGKVRSVGQVTR